MSPRWVVLAIAITILSSARLGFAGDDLTGTWQWSGDSDGAHPSAGALVVLHFTGKTLTLTATQPGDTATFTGRYQAGAGKITLTFDQDPGGGQKATNQPYQRKTTELILPFGIANPTAKSTWKRLKDNVYVKVERGTCPREMGMCNAATLAGQSLGGECLFNVAYQDTTVLEKQPVCFVTCADRSLEPQTNSCKGLGACYRAFEGKKSMRSFADLDAPTQKEITGLYAQVVQLAIASAPREALAKTAQDLNEIANKDDPQRTAIESKLLDRVMSTMAPYDWACVNAGERKQVKWKYAGALQKKPQVAVKDADAGSPMSFPSAYEFRVYFAAFVDRIGKAFVPVRPEVTVALMLHELVHFGQPDRGLGDSASIQDSQLQLSELEAYGKMAIHLFFRWMLRPAEFRDLVDVGRNAQIAAFPKTFPSGSDALALARWAWGQPWMQRRMVTDPTADGGVWAKLCNVKKSPCQGPLAP